MTLIRKQLKKLNDGFVIYFVISSAVFKTEVAVQFLLQSRTLYNP